MMNWMLSRRMVAGLAAGSMLFFGAVSAQAGPIEELGKIAAQASPAGEVAAPNISPSAPVTKFSATGRINEILASGGCANNPLITSSFCSPSTNCDSVTMTGQVNATGLGKANLNACLIIILTPTSSLGECLVGTLGVGTLTAANGNSINVSFGGNFCLANEVLGPPPILDFNSLLSYAVQGGTGPFVAATGNGSLTASDILVNPSSLPYSGTGEITMTGTLSKN
jgi:hypothetical protein